MKILITAISPEDFSKLIRKTHKKQFKVAFLLGFGSGMRLSEIVGSCKKKSNCCEEDLIKEKKKDKNMIITCSKCKKELNMKKDTYVSDEVEIKPVTEDMINTKDKSIRIKGKGEVERIVPLPKGFKEYMLKLLPLNKTYSNIKSARRSMQRAFKTAAKRAGILKKNPKLHFHSLRHGFGTHMANQGIPIHHIKTLMGHSNISTTNVYLESNPKKALESYEELF